MIGFSHAAATDMPFSGMLTVAMVCAAVVLRLAPDNTGASAFVPAATEPSGSLSKPSQQGGAPHTSMPSASAAPAASTPWLALILFGFFLGLAVLAKGPAGIVLCGGAVFFWAAFTKRWRDAFRLLHPAALAAFCGTALPWYVLCARRNPDFFRVFIIEHNFRRYLTPEFQHIQPFWFYLPVLLAAQLPWTLLFAWNAVTGARELVRTRKLPEFTWFLTCWPGFTIFFFTISKSKLPGYVLPAVPPLAILAAREVMARIKNSATARAWLSLAGLTLILLGILSYKFNDAIPFVTDIRPALAVERFAMLASLGGIVVIVLALLRRPTSSVLAIVFSVLSFLTLDTGDLWELDEGVSARPTVAIALNHLTPEQTGATTVFKLRRAYKYQIDFYLHRETRDWSPDAKLHSIVFTDYKNSAELVRLGGWCPPYIAFPAVWVCEGAKEPSILRGSSSGSRQPQ
jgi:4-amino-4-deoxy-L-arabinose transferase-like glycosyltransferase